MSGPPFWEREGRRESEMNRKYRHSIRRSQKPYPRTKHEVDQITRCGDMAIRVSWGHMEHPPLGGREGTIRKSDGGFLCSPL